ncbi:MAG TPA: hypothetical protein VFQ79_21085 [Bryobacteraceae bacterium]|nr:hypothetical protein [Bryobacteraceae bacterium]
MRDREKQMKITDQFKEWAARLAAMEPGADPFVSCYLDLSPGFLTRFDSSARAAKKGLRPRERRAVTDALARVESFLKIDAGRGEGGVAIFSRAGVDPFFLTLPLDVPVSTICTIAPRPDTSGLLALTEQGDSAGFEEVAAPAY